MSALSGEIWFVSLLNSHSLAGIGLSFRHCSLSNWGRYTEFNFPIVEKTRIILTFLRVCIPGLSPHRSRSYRRKLNAKVKITPQLKPDNAWLTILTHLSPEFANSPVDVHYNTNARGAVTYKRYQNVLMSPLRGNHRYQGIKGITRKIMRPFSSRVILVEGRKGLYLRRTSASLRQPCQLPGFSAAA